MNDYFCGHDGVNFTPFLIKGAALKQIVLECGPFHTPKVASITQMDGFLYHMQLIFVPTGTLLYVLHRIVLTWGESLSVPMRRFGVDWIQILILFPRTSRRQGSRPLGEAVDRKFEELHGTCRMSAGNIPAVNMQGHLSNTSAYL